MLAANNVRLFFRIFTSQTTAALTYQEVMGMPIEGYLQTAGANPIALPGQSGGQWLSFPCFAEGRAAVPGSQVDTNNVKNITAAEHNKFFGVLLDTNLSGNYLPSSPSAIGEVPLPQLLMGEHQCLVAQIEFAGTPIPNGANPSTSDKLAQRNIALSEVANPGLAASRVAVHTFEIEATPHSITDTVMPDELLLDWSSNLVDDTYVNIEIPGWNAHQVVALADRFYPLHEIRALDAHTVQLPGGGIRYVPIPMSLYRQTGVISVELPLGIKKGQRFDVSVRQITNRGRDVRAPSPKVTEISLEEANKLLAGLFKEKSDKKIDTRAKAGGLPELRRGVFDLGNNRSLVTDLSVFDAVGDHALLIQHPDPKEVDAARRASRQWRETIGAFQLGIPVSTKDDMLLHHLRLLSVMTWRATKLSRKSRWYATFMRYVELLTDKVRALGGDPFAIPATPDGVIPQLPGANGQTGDTTTPGNGGAGDPKDPYFESSGDDWLGETLGLASSADAKPGIWSGKISGLLFDHFGDFEGFTLESYGGSHARFFSRETAIHDLAITAWRERYVVTVISVAAKSHQVRRLLIRGYVD